jgi:FAD/FMN-containing dehydrogenase
MRRGGNVTTDPESSGRTEEPGASTKAPGRRRFLLMAGAAVSAGAVGSRSLANGSTGAGGTGAGGTSLGGTSVGPTSSGGQGTADWNALGRSLSSRELVRPGQDGYNAAKELYDPRFDNLMPAGIAYCRTPGDVAACLGFAARFGLPVRARSGGHSFAGWSSVTGGLIVDVTQISSFEVGVGTVRVGTGMSLIDFYQELAARGLAVPGGTCPTVGLAGLVLGGGVSVLSRLYGLTCDNLESVQIVTADGRALDCDSGHDGDLLWACRGGGGGNFGVATSFTLRTRPLPKLVLFFLTWPWSMAGSVVEAWQSWAPFAPDALFSNMHVSSATGGAPQVGVGGSYVGRLADAAGLLQELYDLIGSGPSSSFLNEESYLDAMLIEAGCNGLSVPECSTGRGGRLGRVPSYAKSDFFSQSLSASAIDALLAAIEGLGSVEGSAGGEGAIGFDAFGGAINRVDPAATAFVHRDALFDAQYTTSWRNPGSAAGVANQHAWLRASYACLHPHANGQAYQNYVDPDLTNWRQAYYGANYARLARVKVKYDPHQLFRFPQGITP